eukprot:TRINITY_DN3047_c1_g1_i2.p1 TRINITY_DN3047_c1_g1~~TRINITY_DN3047_c1_g1_i2.p1  ORF type:complete len:731 (+),score=66.72 TRINITY_DN3047_c1_g1_i2:296-2194(+)
MLRFCSHLWFLPSCGGVFSPVSCGDEERFGASPWHTFFAFVDFRKESIPVVRHLPSLLECMKLAKKAKPLKRCKPTNTLRYEDCIPRPPFDVDFLRTMSKDVVCNGLRDCVLDSLVNGFSSGYTGSSYFQRDFSMKLDGDDLKLAMAKMEKEVKKGYYLGPFDECPFPSSWCDSQAFICQLFLIPKHKFINDGEFRLIANRSFPDGRSFNDLVPRRDCTTFIPNYSYFTFHSFLEQVRRAGPRSLIGLFDVKDAYKNCRMKPDDLWQQVYCVGGKFFVDLGGMFGSRNAGDAWNLVMEFIAQCIRFHCIVPELRYFVDNAVNLTPALRGKEDYAKAGKDFDKIIDFLRQAKVPFHQDLRPSTKVRFLGWDVDTVTMTVTCPDQRLLWIKKILEENSKKITKTVVRSVVGLLEFVAAVLPFLRAPLGWLQKRSNALEAGKEIINEEFMLRFRAYFNYIEALLRDWSGSASILAPFALTSNPDLVIYSDASGEFGYGAIEVNTKSFGCGVWTDEEISAATRQKAVSSTQLEIMAMVKAIKTFARPKCTCHVFADSAAAVFIMQKRYDKNGELSQALIISLDRYCRDNGIAIVFSHVRREHRLIQVVDALSKGSIPDMICDWKKVLLVSVQPTVF